jgi:hypothetical protein
MAVVVVAKVDLKGFTTFADRVRLAQSGNFRLEMSRAVEDAGRKSKTKVQRAVYQQMAVLPGHYQGYVVANTRGVPNRGALSYTISASMKGTDIRIYKGLRALKSGGAAAKRFNMNRNAADAGTVRSGVWNNPRTFKRSFEQGGEYLALIPSGGKRSSASLPRSMWTFGRKNQPRSATGQFVSKGRQGFRIRRLYGPALGKELGKGQSAQTFDQFATLELEKQVWKRLQKML